MFAWAAGVTLFLGGLAACYYHADQYYAHHEPGIASHPPLTPDRAFHGLVFCAGYVAAAAGVMLLGRITPNPELRDNVARLGSPDGMPLVAVCLEIGFDYTEEADDGRTLATWAEPGYAITLAFRDGVCVGVVGEKVG